MQRRPKLPLAAAVLTALVCLSLLGLSSRSRNQPSPTHRQLVPPNYPLLRGGNSLSLPSPYLIHTLPSWDRSTLIDIKHFHFHLNNFPCNYTSSLLLLVLVHSAPGNIEKRQTIRETWGGHLPATDSYRVLFLLGEVDTQQQQAALEEENRIHRDLVQGSFRDAYKNLTYKHVMALKWTTYYCPGAHFLLKTDDDMFVNTPALLDFLVQRWFPRGPRRLILCNVRWFSPVIRSKCKWQVLPKEYAGETYPPYCSGWFILYSSDAVFLLYREAQRTEYFWVDDAYVTGTLAARVGLTQTPIGPLVLFRKQLLALLNTSSTTISPTSVSENSKENRPAFLFGGPNIPS